MRTTPGVESIKLKEAIYIIEIKHIYTNVEMGDIGILKQCHCYRHEWLPLYVTTVVTGAWV